jgi:hypothetical protein
LATVHVLPKRYADLDRSIPFVASIIITPISRSSSCGGTGEGSFAGAKS